MYRQNGRRKVLISAYACEPGRGSEPGVGWNQVQQAARFHEVWVMTRANNRRSIQRALEAHPAPYLHWVYLDLPRWMRFWKRGGRGVHAYYLLWQLAAYLVARRLNCRIGFDLAHHVTFVNYWMPSLIALLPVPFLWGPVGGGETFPRALLSSFGPRGRRHELLRDLARRLGELNPLVRLTAKRADLALATTAETERRLKLLGCRQVSVLAQIGLTSEEATILGQPRIGNRGGLRVLSVGNLLHLKGYHLALEAFCQFQRRFPDCEYCLIGDGPERSALQNLSTRLGISTKVRFAGSLARQEVLRRFAHYDVLLHPVLHDSGGLVCLEAMAAGLPVICLRLGGPGVHVSDEVGFRIPAVCQEQVVADMADALLRLAEDPGLRERKGRAGQERVQHHFTWDAKGEAIAGAYRRLLEC